MARSSLTLRSVSFIASAASSFLAGHAAPFFIAPLFDETGVSILFTETPLIIAAYGSMIPGVIVGTIVGTTGSGIFPKSASQRGKAFSAIAFATSSSVLTICLILIGYFMIPWWG